MYIILVYDADAKRDPKILKLCRRYLTWVQNSVFEGELTEAKYKMLKRELQQLINAKEDSIVAYQLRTTHYYRRDIIGREKGGVTNLL
ncbi:MAG: CRISPR-associated endonuclease Cas2 [Firmicutes bacterium]|nr:CRISPR-associated endonuclease Cas2 [Bacillota bacterium]